MPRVVKVIENETSRGRGIADDPTRIVTEYWTVDGNKLLAISDTWFENQVPQLETLTGRLQSAETVVLDLADRARRILSRAEFEASKRRKLDPVVVIAELQTIRQRAAEGLKSAT